MGFFSIKKSVILKTFLKQDCRHDFQNVVCSLHVSHIGTSTMKLFIYSLRAFKFVPLGSF